MIEENAWLQLHYDCAKVRESLLEVLEVLDGQVPTSDSGEGFQSLLTGVVREFLRATQAMEVTIVKRDVPAYLVAFADWSRLSLLYMDAERLIDAIRRETLCH